VRALLIHTGRRVSPFDEAPGLALYGRGTVGSAVRAALQRRGLPVVELAAGDDIPADVVAGDGPVVVLADHCFVTEKCLGDFLGRAFDVVAGGGEARLALARTPSVDFLRPVSSVAVEDFDDAGPGARVVVPGRFATRHENAARQRVAYDCFFVPRLAAGTAGELLEGLRARARRVVVPKKELGIPLRLPTLGEGGGTLLIPVTSTLAAHVEHWVHVLWLNQAGFGAQWLELVRAHKGWAAVRALCALARPSWGFAAFTRSFVRRGRNARIHPTAHVEASILGDDVEIGAGASVRNAVLGDGVVVGDHATVLSSTLGARARVTPRTFVVWSAAYEDAVLSNYKLQVSLIGRGASLSTWAGLIDAKLQGSVEVRHDGRLVSTERSFLGSCLGHGAHVGAKVLLLPGREIPAGAFVAMRPDELIVDVPRALPPGVPLVRDQGALVPLASLTAATTSASPSSDTPPAAADAAPILRA
jgi:acetyltransferase-like isoleucine patch superfamily enzyme